jgi:hypothetical protein
VFLDILRIWGARQLVLQSVVTKRVSVVRKGNGSCAVISNRRGSLKSEMLVKLGFKVQC